MTIPYVKNPTWADGSGGGTPINAAKLNTIEDGIFGAHYQPAVRAKRATALSVSNNTWTLLALTGEDFDTAANAADTMHDNSTNPARLIARYAGKYAFSAYVTFDSNSTGIRALHVQKNSETLPATENTGVVQGGQSVTAVNGTTTLLTASGIVDMVVNDYLACVVFQNSGGALNANTDTNFEMVRVA